jgi:asparagine synthase (glutamine-hydrolysing)
MCGIGGFSGSFPAPSLAQALGALALRGPDDSGAFFDIRGLVGLGHRRLSIIDLSPFGHQPMASADGEFVIVFNGEIYNFRELRSGLSGSGYPFKGNSDTEVLLALYTQRGEAMLRELNGIFAFALYDKKRQELFLACDNMGVKPLYFTENVDGFAFASELKAMLAAGWVQGEVDVAALAGYLAFLWSPGGRTPFAGVQRLGPGEALRVKAGRIVRRWQWARSTWDVLANSHYGNADQAALGVANALRTAVQRQLVADVPVGAFLSGGLDSSSIVAMAKESAPDIECFTIALSGELDAGFTDDLPYARRVAKHLGVRLHEVAVDSAAMAQNLEEMVYLLDEPLADPAPLNVRYISRLARQHGMKVLLSGAGGDDLFSGYRRHQALMLERWWAWLPAGARALLRRWGERADHASALGRRLGKAFEFADGDESMRLMGYLLWARPNDIAALFAPDHRPKLAGRSLTAACEEYLTSLPPRTAPLNKMLALEQRFFLADHNLLYTDKMSMAESVEVRVPFLDNDLVALANGLPTGMKLRHGECKWILKKAMEPYLPRDVIYRPKTGFGAPLRRWLRHELRELMMDTLSAASIERRGLFDATAVQCLISDNEAGRRDAAYTIFSLMCIEIWCRKFLDGARHSRQYADVVGGADVVA